MSPLQIRAAAELEKRKRQRAKDQQSLAFFDFVNQVSRGKYIWYQHVKRLGELLQDVADGKLKRLLVVMPPRHGKSELVSRLFSAYHLYRHPDKWVGLASYGASLSYTFSRAARDNFLEAGGKLRDDSRSVQTWQTSGDGGVWAAGVGGSITGRGFDCGIIDDPIKDAQEANSITIRTRNEDWIDSTFLTRAEPGAAIVMVTTRWGKFDPAGYLLEKENEAPEGWHIVHMEAIKTGVQPDYPKTCVLEPDYREVGEALCPERYDLAALDKIRLNVGQYYWDTLYQQSPQVREGLVYYAFNDDCVITKDKIDYDKCTFFLALDFGAVNEAFGLYAYDGEMYVKVYEAILPAGTTAQRAEYIKKRVRRFIQVEIDRIKEDHNKSKKKNDPDMADSEAFKLAWRNKVINGYGGSKSEVQIRRDYAANGIQLRAPRLQDVESQIRKTNEMFTNGTLKVLNTMALFKNQVYACVYDPKGNIADQNIWHHLDETRYLASGVSRQKIRVLGA